jgi:hypothetical protein
VSLSPESPGSPGSPFDSITTPKYEEVDSDGQVSLEFDDDELDKVEKIQDYSLIDKFFLFLDQVEEGEELNPTLSGYFCNIIQVVIKNDPKELYKYLVHSNFVQIEKMIKHIGDQSISEIFTKLIFEIIKIANLDAASGVPSLKAS